MLLEDGLLGLQNVIAWSNELQRHRSALSFLKSKDGISWQYLNKAPLLQPSHGWMSSYIHSGECRQNSIDKKWYLYFSAGNKGIWSKSKERIGLIIGQ